MRRWKQSPCPMANDQCPQFRNRQGCYEDYHHLYYPRGTYKTDLEIAFRGLQENMEKMCRQEHEDIHTFDQEPEKPDVYDMIQALTIKLPEYVERAA